MSRRPRVLIIDDNPDLASALEAVLTGGPAARLGLDVVTVARGRDALEVAQTEGFDVALVDMLLPDGSGVDLIAPLREAAPFGEVVLFTGFATMDAAMAALRWGAFAFMPKSFRPEELLATVEQALGKSRLQRERDELERRYRALVDLTDVLVVGFDSANRAALFNPKAVSVTGVSSDDAAGLDFLETWVPSDDRGRLREALSQVRSGGRPRDVEADLAGRRVRWHLSRAADLVYGIGIDITERRALEKRAADAEALSAMGALALNLAHEVRNPLNAAVLQLHMLGRDIDKLEVDAGVRGRLHQRGRIVEIEVGRLTRLLTEFLELARPRAIAREAVHLGELVNAVLDLELAAAAARNVTIERSIARDGCTTLGDAEKLKQVVLNLVVNALEAMRDGGTLSAHVARDAAEPDLVRMTIADTGPGFAPEALANAFDPFFTTKEAGTGLGLSIVRKIVEHHGGEVRIESEGGVGSRVHVRLPSSHPGT